MNKILNKVKWILLVFAIVVVEQSALLLLKGSQSVGKLSLVILLMLAISLGTWLIAKKVGLLYKKEDDQKHSAPFWIGMGLLGVTLVKILGGIILVLQNGNGKTLNQDTLNGILLNPVLLIVLLSIVAPIVEETVFRGLLMGKVFNHRSIPGLIISSFLFGLLYSPTDIGSWVIYGGTGLLLGFVYYKTNKLSYTMGIHCLSNSLAALFMIASTLLK
ncbi:CPBP family intramembrane glutamic endopeptidase [Streptococcus didelphis]